VVGGRKVARDGGRLALFFGGVRASSNGSFRLQTDKMAAV
jgi:hypothetical protein